MPHKRDGFVPLGDIAGTVELPGDRALTPAAPEARHHFTRLDQIDQLVDASEVSSASDPSRAVRRQRHHDAERRDRAVARASVVDHCHAL